MRKRDIYLMMAIIGIVGFGLGLLLHPTLTSHLPPKVQPQVSVASTESELLLQKAISDELEYQRLKERVDQMDAAYSDAKKSLDDAQKEYEKMVFSR